MINVDKIYVETLERLKSKVLPSESILLIPHDFPDPDSIGAALGLQHLFGELGVKKCDIAFAGFIGRAENRAMVRELGIEYLNLLEIDIESYDSVITVDTLPDNGNVSIKDISIIDVAIDHHPPGELEEHPNTLYEIHTTVGATSTIITSFYMSSGIVPTSRVATALFYGIKTDTNDMARNCHDIDIICYKYLFDLIEHKILSKIETPERDIEYFRLLHVAAHNLSIYDNIGYTHIGDVSVPDYAPEIADIYISMKDLEWMICSAIFGNTLIFSLRSKSDQRAGFIARKLALTLGGSGGGHPTMAAGRIPIGEYTHDEIKRQFAAVLLEIFNTVDVEPVYIVDGNRE